METEKISGVYDGPGGASSLFSAFLFLPLILFQASGMHFDIFHVDGLLLLWRGKTETHAVEKRHLATSARTCCR